MGSEARQLHLFFFPLMAHGHTIPIIDIARLFAARGNKSTIITTPLNAPHFSETIDRERQGGLDIGVEIIQFPSIEAGLPQGCESIDSIPSPEMITNFFTALSLLQQPFEQLLQRCQPDCVVADMFLTWTTEIASKHGIPRLVFHGTSHFTHCLTENIKRYAPHEKVAFDSEIFVVPGLPDQIEMTKFELPDLPKLNNNLTDLIAKVEETELTSFGVLVNSFYELEPAYAEYYKKEMARKAWNVGPVSLYNKSIVDKAQRGQKLCMDVNHILSWLNSREPNSVLYVSFGSISRFGIPQLLEIAMGLEASEVPFIWVVRTAKKVEKNHFLPEGFEERMKGKGLIITNWAPQVLILDHPAVGGFMTHCGWNSTIEGISASLPMITWPMFAEQFNNEKFVTQVLKTGLKAGNEVWNSWVEPENVSVRKERVEKVVTQLMSNGKDAQDMRRRATELGEKAKRAVDEGGSSNTDLTALIEVLKAHSQKSN